MRIITNPLKEDQKQKKSYDELLSEAKSIIVTTAATMIPKLCEALRDGSPVYSNREIRQKVSYDCQYIWAASTIQNSLPSWILDETRQKAQKLRWEKQHAFRLDNASKKLNALASDSISEYALDNQIEIPEQFRHMELERFHEEDRRIHEFMQFRWTCQHMLRELTGLGWEFDFTKEFNVKEQIESTRDFRTKAIDRLNDADKTKLWNLIKYLDLVIHDTINIMRDHIK